MQIGADRVQHSGQVLELDSSKQIAALPLAGMPHPGSGITWEYQGRPVLATPNLKDSKVTVIDMQNWEVIAVACAATSSATRLYFVCFHG